MLMIALLSCMDNPDVLPPAEYTNWVETEENGLVNARQMEDIVFTVHYLSKEEMALRETGGDTTGGAWQAAMDAKGNMQYYKLVFRLAEGNQDVLRYDLRDETEYFSRSNYLAFGIEKDVYLLCGDERLPCRLHQFTPMYGIAPQAEVVFAFDETDPEHTKNRTLVIEDQLFGSGILQFEFTAENIKNIPTIQF